MINKYAYEQNNDALLVAAEWIIFALVVAGFLVSIILVYTFFLIIFYIINNIEQDCPTLIAPKGQNPNWDKGPVFEFSRFYKAKNFK